MHAIIFLAPLTFNLRLEEDPTVNRIEDSIMIWKALCSNTLLEQTVIILFLNKMDVLVTALQSGLRVKDHVISYGDLPNDAPSVVKCTSSLPCTSPLLIHLPADFRERFRAYHVRTSLSNRGVSHSTHRKGYRPSPERSSGTKLLLLYVDCTPPASANTIRFPQDPSATGAILVGVREGILRYHLSKTEVI